MARLTLSFSGWSSGPVLGLVPLGDVVNDIQDCQRRISTTTTGMMKQMPTRDLVVMVESCVHKVNELLGDLQEIERIKKDSLDNFLGVLQNIQHYWSDSRISARIRRGARALTGNQKKPDALLASRVKVDLAFRAVEAAFAAPTFSPANSAIPFDTESLKEAASRLQASGRNAAPADDRFPDAPSLATSVDNHDPLLTANKPGSKGDRFENLVDGTKKFLQATSIVAGVVPDPVSKLVKVIAETGLSIIMMLQDMDDNQEEASRIAQHISQLMKSVSQFLQEAQDSVSDDSRKALDSFQRKMASVEEGLAKLKSQGKLQKAMAHERNKEDLAEFEVQIDRAFKELQTHLASNSLLLLTRMDAADARRERDRLLDRLGGADNGVRSKVADPDDLLCLPGTRKELLRGIDRWISDPSSESILWINGVAGCGKTAVAATIARRQQDTSATVATFYFDRGNQKRNESVICSLSRWLACASHGSLERFVLQSVQSEPDIATLPLTTQFNHLLIKPLKKVAPDWTPTVIIIDALDEWHDSRQASALITLIRKHASELPSQVKFVITSRNEGHLANSFRSKCFPTGVNVMQLDRISSVDVDRDIESFLTARFSAIQPHPEDSIVGRPEWPGSACIKELVGLSHGLFQWAATVMRYIQADGSHEARLQDIRGKPNHLGSLDELYEHILKQLFKEHTRPSTISLLQHVLGFIAVARVPITLDVIAYFYADNANDFVPTKNRIQDEILTFLGSFLVIPDVSAQPIRFLHPSFAEFITKHGSDSRFHIEFAVHHERIAFISLQRLDRDLKRNICTLDNPLRPNVEIQSQVMGFIPHGLRYSCCYWADHLSHADRPNFTTLLKLLGQFCHVHLLHWLEVLSLIGQMELAFAAASQALRWMEHIVPCSTSPVVGELLRDTQRLIASFFELISQHAQHIYISALAQIPKGTRLSEVYADAESSNLRVLLGPIGSRWPASVWATPNVGGSCRDVRFSPNGTTIASVSYDGSLRLWNADSGMSKSEPLMGHLGSVICDCIAFSPVDGTTIATASPEGIIRMWDVESGKTKGQQLTGQQPTGEFARVARVVFSPDGSTIASESIMDQHIMIQVWDVKSGMTKCEPLTSNDHGPTCVTFSPDGNMITSITNGDYHQSWDVESGMATGKPPTGHSRWKANSFAFAALSPNQNTIAAAQTDGSIQVRDVKSGVAKCPPLPTQNTRVQSVALSPDGDTVVSVSEDGGIRLWEIQTGVLRCEPLMSYSGSVKHVVFSPDGKTIASGSEHGSIQLWDYDLSIGEPCNGHSGWVTSVLFSPDGKTIASASIGGSVRLWDSALGMAKGKPLIDDTDWVRCILFSFDGKIIALVSSDGSCQLWDIDSGVAMGKPMICQSGSIRSVVFSEDGKMIASLSSEGDVQLWDTGSGMARGDTLRVSAEWISLKFSHDGRTLIASDTESMTIANWDVGDIIGTTDVFLHPPPTAALRLPNIITSGGTVSPNGWVYYNDRPWFWLHDSFGRRVQWQRYGERVVIKHDQYIHILDVSEIAYIVDYE